MVFGLFSKESALKRAQKKALNRLAQSADRWAALEKLRDAGDDESLMALCRRFSFTSLKSVEDEQEKAWVVESLSAKGEAALPALKRYMQEATSVAYPLRVLENAASKAEALAVIDELMLAEKPGYTRDPSKRVDYIDWLAEWQPATNDEVAERVIPYLADYDENVRYAAVEAIAHRPTPKATPALLDALVRQEEESKRLQIRIAEVLSDIESPLGEQKKAVQPLLEDVLGGFRLHRDKLVRK